MVSRFHMSATVQFKQQAAFPLELDRLEGGGEGETRTPDLWVMNPLL
jgi:hypothetical protein